MVCDIGKTQLFPTLDNDTRSKRTFQRQEQVRDDITGRYHATDHTMGITHWTWYLPIKKARADANQEYPPRTHQEINIREIRTPTRTVFTQEHNE